MPEKRPSLNVLSGPLAGKVFVIEDAVDNILIGSDPSCTFVIDAPGVSPVHARLWVDLHGATVYDTNTPTGVYVNDDRVVKEAPLRNGDILWLGPPGEEGSVLIQCILPTPAPGAARAEESPMATAETIAAAEAVPVEEAEDTSATVAFRGPAIRPPEPEVEAAPVVEEAPEDATVVMSSSAVPEGIDLGGPATPPAMDEPPAEVTFAETASEHEFTPASGEAPNLSEPEATISYAPPRAAAPVMDDNDGLEVLEGAAGASADAGFPDFEVDSTVALPPPIPARAPVAAPAPPSVPEFEEDIEPTMVDVPPPTVARPAPAPPPPPVAAAPPAVEATRLMKPQMNKDAAAAAAPPPIPPRKAAPVAPAGGATRPSAPAAPRTPTPPTPPPAARPGPTAPKSQRPAAAPPPAAPARRAGGGGAGKGGLVAGAVVVVVAVLAAAGYWFLGRRAQPGVPVSATTPAPPPPTQAAPPSTAVAVAPPSTEAAAPETLAAAPATTPTAIPEAVTVVRSPVPSPRVAAGPSAAPSGPAPKASPPGPRGGASPGAAASAAPNPAQQTAAAVASLMGQARAAADQHNYDAAVAMYDEVLKLEPQNAAATSGRTAAVSARTAASASRKTFVSGHTVVQTEQKGKADVSGFDSSDVVKRSPDFQGRLEFTMSPPNVKPGDNYRLQIALVNEGKKPIKISGMTFTITADGNKTGNPVAPKVKEVAPSQRVVLEELPGVFPEASTWVAEVLVTANKGDSLKNQLTWR